MLRGLRIFSAGNLGFLCFHRRYASFCGGISPFAHAADAPWVSSVTQRRRLTTLVSAAQSTSPTSASRTLVNWVIFWRRWSAANRSCLCFCIFSPHDFVAIQWGVSVEGFLEVPPSPVFGRREHFAPLSPAGRGVGGEVGGLRYITQAVRAASPRHAPRAPLRSTSPPATSRRARTPGAAWRPRWRQISPNPAASRRGA